MNVKPVRETTKKRSLFHGLPDNRAFMILLSILAGILLWQLLYLVLRLPNFILPGPLHVWLKMLLVLRSGLLWRHFSYTLLEVVLGLVCGGAAASLIGYCLSRSPRAERFFSPYLVASQSVPIVAIAPLLVIWFGPGLFSKVLICALTVFFPVLVNTLVALREIPQDLRELMHSLRSTPGQTLRYLELPGSLPVFLGGLRVGATLSVIGAIVGELVGSDRGLGFLINVARGQYDTALVFVTVITLMVMAAALYGLILLIETRLLSWQTWRQESSL